jgi:hypothetical protein
MHQKTVNCLVKCTLKYVRNVSLLLTEFTKIVPNEILHEAGANLTNRLETNPYLRL